MKLEQLSSLLTINDSIGIFNNTEIALERETLRVKNNKVSNTKHPKVFEPKEKHKYITTDYGESQPEFITPVFNNPKDLTNFLDNLYDIFSLEMEEDEILWPYSMPCDISNIEEVEEAIFEINEDDSQYRKMLTNKYGKEKQLISGIHYNFSFNLKFLKEVYKILEIKKSFSTFVDDIYLKIIRNYNRHKHLVVLLFGASPVSHKSFNEINNAISIRNTQYGYRNLEKLNICYATKEKYLESINKAIDSGIISSEKEDYSSVRIKTSTKKVLSDLKNEHIKYIEVRNIDINPYVKNGIGIDALKFMELFMLYCLLFDEEQTELDACNHCKDDIALYGNFGENFDSCGINIYDYSRDIVEDMIYLGKELNIDTTFIEDIKVKFDNKDFLYKKIQNDIDEKGYFEFFNSLGEKYKKSALNNRYKYYGLENMELSTQILVKESIKNSVKVDIVDSEDNFIRLEKDNNIQYVKQATKTSRDNYVTVLAMENKVVTKKILEENNINTPKGDDFVDEKLAYKYAKRLKQNFVIKPKSTNFGLGINIFKDEPTDESLKKAIEIAFSYDKTILIEEYIDGLEYRFLVIGDKVAGILHREPANVIGNGINSIKELVEEKNKDALRGEGYKTPLEKIKIDDNVKIFLKEQSIDENYIPKNNEKVYLRINSNISTGGDSIDLTDEIHEKFKEVAVNASKSVGAIFCGVDVIIDDYTNPDSNYSIIELNFNPAIHIHSFPFKGKERNIAKDILKVLGY